MDIDELLAASLTDGRFSRAEKKALRGLLSDSHASHHQAEHWASRAFHIAKKHAGDDRPSVDLITWLYEVLKTIHNHDERHENSLEEVSFSPGPEPRHRIVSLIGRAQSTIDCCVFTITDNDIVEALLQAHRRGIEIRIVSDDRKSEDRGSDIDRLAREGVGVRLDSSPAHMHHKFCIFDGRLLLTGSYNWTRSAASENQENVLVTSSPAFVEPFVRTFETLWARFGAEH